MLKEIKDLYTKYKLTKQVNELIKSTKDLTSLKELYKNGAYIVHPLGEVEKIEILGHAITVRWSEVFITVDTKIGPVLIEGVYFTKEEAKEASMMVIQTRKQFLIDAKKDAEKRIQQIKELLKDFRTYKKSKCTKWKGKEENQQN